MMCSIAQNGRGVVGHHRALDRRAQHSGQHVRRRPGAPRNRSDDVHRIARRHGTRSFCFCYCRMVEELIDLVFEWLEHRVPFEGERDVYIKRQAAQTTFPIVGSYLAVSQESRLLRSPPLLALRTKQRQPCDQEKRGQSTEAAGRTARIPTWILLGLSGFLQRFGRFGPRRTATSWRCQQDAIACAERGSVEQSPC
jgi:hypothetical protein